MEIQSKIACPQFSLLSQKNLPSLSSAVIYSDICCHSVFSWWNRGKEWLWEDFHTGWPMWSRRDCHYAVQWSSNIAWGHWVPEHSWPCPPACLPARLWLTVCTSTCLSAWLHVCFSACQIICLSHSPVCRLVVCLYLCVCPKRGTRCTPGIRLSSRRQHGR